MERLKLTTLRISQKSLQRAEKIASSEKYYTQSDVLRLAISLGLHIIGEHIFNTLYHQMYQQEMGNGHWDIDVKWVPNDSSK